MNDYLIDLLKAVRDHAIDVEQGERRYHLTNDELVIAALRYQDNVKEKTS